MTGEGSVPIIIILSALLYILYISTLLLHFATKTDRENISDTLSTHTGEM